MPAMPPKTVDERVNRLEKRLGQMQMLHWFMLCGMIVIVSLLGISQSRLGNAVGEVIRGQIQMSQAGLPGYRSPATSLEAASASGPARTADERMVELERRVDHLQMLLWGSLSVLTVIVGLLLVSLSKLGRAFSAMIVSQCVGAGESNSARGSAADK